MRSSGNAAGPPPDPDPRTLVARCRGNAPLMGALRDLYRQVDQAVAEARLTCLGGGACCRFDVFGHRLFVTAPELALLTVERPPSRPRPGRCPYQVGPECRAYARRPLACRTFFCTAEGRNFTRRLHEAFHGRLRRLHETHCIPYLYADLCGLLVQLSTGE